MKVRVGDKFEIFGGDVVTLTGIRKVPRYIQGETETRGGRFQTSIRLDDATVYECESCGVSYTNSEYDMGVLVRGSTLVRESTAA